MAEQTEPTGWHRHQTQGVVRDSDCRCSHGIRNVPAPVSAEFRLSDEQREALLVSMRSVVSIYDPTAGPHFAAVESIVASEVEAAERALVERIEAVCDEWEFPIIASRGHDSPMAVRVDRIRAALTRPATCDHEFEARSTIGPPYESCDKCGTTRELGATP